MANTGNIFPGTGTSVARGTNTDWTNPGNIVSNNATDATCSSGATGSDYLRASNFGFSLAAGAVIQGVTVRVEASEHTSGTESLNVQLVDDAGVLIGASKAATISGTAKAVYTYGSTSDLWSATLTEAIVEDTDFGVQCWFTTTHDVRVDYITIALEYIVALTQSPSDTLNNWNDSVIVGLGTVFTDTLSLSDATIVEIGLIFSDSLTLSDELNLGIGLVFTDDLNNLADAIEFQLLGFQSQSFSDVLKNYEGPTDSRLYQLGYLPSFEDTITFADNLELHLGLIFEDTLVLTDAVVINLSHVINRGEAIHDVFFWATATSQRFILGYLIDFTDSLNNYATSSEIELNALGGSDVFNNNMIMLDLTLSID